MIPLRGMRRGFLIAASLALIGCTMTHDANPRVTLETSLGAITVELYPDKAPITVANFLRYVDQAYDGATIYRVTRPSNDPLINVIQGGLWRPWETGMIADYKPPFPPIVHETTEMSGLAHTDGVLSMGRFEPGTANSEFFISVGDNPSLDFGGERNPDGQGFAAFGRVIAGMDIVRTIHSAPTRDGEGLEAQILSQPIAITTIRRSAALPH